MNLLCKYLRDIRSPKAPISTAMTVHFHAFRSSVLHGR